MTNLSRTLWASAAAICALAAASNAHADVYQYTETGGPGLTIANVGVAPGQGTLNGTLTVDTAAGTGSLVGTAGNGNSFDINFTGHFGSFTGGASPLSSFMIMIQPGSDIVYGGKTYSLVDTGASHPDMLNFETGKAIRLWAEWQDTGCASCKVLGDLVGTISSGGTPVPEPGMVGLMGLGVLGLAFRRRIAAIAARHTRTA